MADTTFTHSPSTDSPASLRIPRVVAIAGTDPSGGAGIHADLKTIGAAGGYGMSATTAIVSQNTHGLTADIFYPPTSVLLDQLRSIALDVDIDAVKIGMLGTPEIINTVGEWLREAKPPIVVLDPVMVATSGDRLATPEAETALRSIIPLATVITPNTPEMAILAGEPEATTPEEAIAQAQRLAARYHVAVVAKAGHLTGPVASNWWVEADGVKSEATARRVDTTNTHGTGCSLSSALATRLAMESPEKALAWMTQWLNEAISYGSEQHVGKPGGHGPVDHFHQIRKAAHTAAPVITTPTFADGRTFDQPNVAAAGPQTLALWQHSAPWFAAIMHMPFIRQLGDGSLPGDAFRYYMEQDAMYLSVYGPVLGHVGDAAENAGKPDVAHHFRDGQQGIEDSELHLHRELDVHPAAMSRITRAYTDLLLARAASGDLAVGIAAVLPCYWYYAEVGTYLRSTPDNPYRSWIDLYGDVPFRQAASRSIGFMENELATMPANDPRRVQVFEAFDTAARYEFEFFQQAELFAGRY